MLGSPGKRKMLTVEELKWLHDEVSEMLDDAALADIRSLEMEEHLNHMRVVSQYELVRRGVTEKPRKYRPGKDGVY